MNPSSPANIASIYHCANHGVYCTCDVSVGFKLFDCSTLHAFQFHHQKKMHRSLLFAAVSGSLSASSPDVSRGKCSKWPDFCLTWAVKIDHFTLEEVNKFCSLSICIQPSCCCSKALITQWNVDYSNVTSLFVRNGYMQQEKAVLAIKQKLEICRRMEEELAIRCSQKSWKSQSVRS